MSIYSAISIHVWDSMPTIQLCKKYTPVIHQYRKKANAKVMKRKCKHYERVCFLLRVNHNYTFTNRTQLDTNIVCRHITLSGTSFKNWL